MPENIRAALLFLITTVFDLYLFVLIIRLTLAFVRADYFNPLTQFIVKLTKPLIDPLRKIIPNIGRIETASIVMLIVVALFKFFLIACLSLGVPHFLGLLVLSIADILKIFLYMFFYAILFQALLSWIQPYSPLNAILYRLTSPIMRPLQRLIPPVGGFDLSPIPALIGLQLLIILLVTPISSLGMQLAFG